MSATYGTAPEVQALGKETHYADQIEKTSQTSDEKGQIVAEDGDGVIVQDWTPAEERTVV